MKPGIKQISDITGFSTATVSNALNKKRGVSKKTSEEIFRVAHEIGYIDHSVISKIKLVIYKKNGLIIDDTPFFNLLISGIEQECRESGYEMSIVNVDGGSDSYEEEAYDILNESGTGIILLGTELSPEDLELYKKAQCPIMLLDFWDINMNFSGVIINNEDSVRMAIHHFSEKGHRKIGYLKGDFRILGFRQRETGYISALAEHGLEYNPEYSVALSTTMNGSFKDMMEYLKKRPNLATAYFADNDMIALGAIKALQENGYKVPEDISIIGFDDLPFSEISTPRLTSLRVPKQEMGRLAVRKMIDLISGEEGLRTKTQVCTEFIERDSVRKL